MVQDCLIIRRAVCASKDDFTTGKPPDEPGIRRLADRPLRFRLRSWHPLVRTSGLAEEIGAGEGEGEAVGTGRASPKPARNLGMLHVLRRDVIGA